MKKEKGKKKKALTVLTEQELASATGGKSSLKDFHFTIGNG